MTNDRPRLKLQPGGDKRAMLGHPWIFSNEMVMDADAKALPPGEIVTIVRPDGRPLGAAYFNPHSLIAARLVTRDADRAIVAAGEVVPDWSGGTRLGETLRVFLDRWGQRGMARGAVVVVFSDGWERGDAGTLGEQMARLRRVAHRVIWVNPHVGKDGYLPVQQGIVAALPFVDDLVAGHSLATFAELVEVVARA